MVAPAQQHHSCSSITPAFIDELQACADTLRANCDAIVVAGIGGSYLGARAVIEALSPAFGEKKGAEILFAGNNISEDYLFELTEYLKNKKFGVINISKSGTTTETALTFRLLKKQCEAQRGKEEAKKVIVAITDAKKGAARTCADKEGYKSFVIPDNVGGRFSVLTPVLRRWRRLVLQAFHLQRTPLHSMLLYVTDSTRTVRRLRLW